MQGTKRIVGTSKGYVAVGSNLSFSGLLPKEMLQKAEEMLETGGLTLCAKSRYFSSPAFPAGPGPDYVNGVWRVEGDMTAPQVLAVLHRIEAAFGRERNARWAARSLDLDLMDWDGAVLPDEATYLHWRNLPLEVQMTDAPGELILPHPRIQDRAFVLQPLCDIAPKWRHPVTGKTAQEMCAQLPAKDVAALVALSD